MGSRRSGALPLVLAMFAIAVVPAGAAAAPGDPDPTFGTAGATTAQFAPGPRGFTRAFGLALAPDGKVLVTGRAGHRPASGDDYGESNVLVARFTPDGAVDPTFGEGGAATAPLAGHGSSIAVQADGKPVVAGSGERSWLVARYTQDGELDPTFGDGGLAPLPPGTRNDNTVYATNVVIQSTGRIVVGGFYLDYQGTPIVMTRYTPDGQVDKSFGGGGVLTRYADGLHDMELGFADRILAVAGESTFQLDAEGTGNDELDSPLGTELSPDAIAGGANGSVVETGTYLPAGGPAPREAVLGRYGAEGEPDPGFGTGGVARLRLGSQTTSDPSDVLVQDERPVLLGTRQGPDVSGAFLARLTLAGQLDCSFGSGGLVALTSGADVQELASDSQQRILSVAMIGDEMGLARHLGGSGPGRAQAPPDATTDAPTDVGMREATLNATVHPRCGDTTVRFQYGRTRDYGSEVAAGTVPGSTSPRPVSARVTGLEPGGAYWVRVVATNDRGTTFGAERSLVTNPSHGDPPLPVRPRRCHVPRLRGRSVRSARRVLTRAGCRLGRVTRRRSRTGRRGRVLSQSPRAGRVRTLGAAVRVVVRR